MNYFTKNKPKKQFSENQLRNFKFNEYDYNCNYKS